MEHWKTIADFEAYEVSDLGRVRRVKLGIGTAREVRNLKPWLHKGYLVLQLCKEGKQYSRSVHSLVAQAFIPNPLSLPEVNHTGDNIDNRACKLEWISTKDHGRDKAKREQGGDGVSLCKATKRNKRRKDVWVAKYNPETGTPKHIGYFDTYKEAKAARDAMVATL